jgi:branched-chain amino acid transport system substrate-binding protein
MIDTRRALLIAAATMFALGCGARGYAQQAEPGVSASEIIIGGTGPLSGPASAYGTIGEGASAYFSYINDKGGVNGRKITYKDLDDAYSPPQTVQLVKQLVEQDHVFAIFNSLGTAPNIAIRPYLNDEKVPQLFVASGASMWGSDGAKYPWTIGWRPDYQAEAIAYARYLLKESPNAKIGVLYQNDDYGQDYLTGLTKGLGAKANMIVKAVSYEVTDTDVTSQIANLKNSGAGNLAIFATPKFSVQAMVTAAEMSWKPAIYLNSVSNSQTVMRAAIGAGGAAATNGVLTTAYVKDPADPRWANDPGMKLYRRIMAKYLPSADTSDGFYLYGMGAAETLVDVLAKGGKNPTRAKVMDATLHLNEPHNIALIPGMLVQTSPADRFPVRQEQLARYEGGTWKLFGSIVDARK